MFDPRIAVLTLAVSGAGALAFGAYRVHAHGGFRGSHGRGDHAMAHKFVDFAIGEKLHEIGATPAQKQKVNEIKERLMKSGRALHESHPPVREEVLALLEKDSLDASQLKALAHARAEEIMRFADEAADALAELHGVLTPEQRKQLLADAREHMARHGR